MWPLANQYFVLCQVVCHTVNACCATNTGWGGSWDLMSAGSCSRCFIIQEWSVFCSCSLLCCSWHKQDQQTYLEGMLCLQEGQAWFSGGVVRADATKATRHHGQYLSPLSCLSRWAQEHQDWIFYFFIFAAKSINSNGTGSIREFAQGGEILILTLWTLQ